MSADTINIKYYNVFIVCIVLFFSFKFLQSTPLEDIFFLYHSMFLIFIGAFVLLYSIKKMHNHEAFDRKVLFFILLIIIVPFYASYRALIEFEQPFIYGYLAQRGWLHLGAGILLYYLLVTDKVSIKDVEMSFLIIAWISLLVYLYYMNVADSSEFINTDRLSRGADFITITNDRGIRFKFQVYFILFGVFYYYIKLIKNKKNIINVVGFMVFIGYILLVVQGRAQIVILFVVLIVSPVIFDKNIYNIANNLFILLLLLLLSVVAIYLYNYAYIDNMLYSYSQMISVLSNEKSSDHSANARIYESAIAIKYMSDNLYILLFGVGAISRQWNTGYNNLFGYFYPEDIGLLGGIFVYGLIGMFFVLVLPLWFTVRELRKNIHKNYFALALHCMLIYCVLGSIQGIYYFRISEYIIPLCLLMGINVVASTKGSSLNLVENQG